MTEFSDETKQWMRAATSGERPFDLAYEHGTMLISLVRDASGSILPEINGGGSVCFRAADLLRQRRLRIKAYPAKRRISFDPVEVGVAHGVLKTDLRIPEPHPDAVKARDVDHSCRFVADNKGYEEIASQCGEFEGRLVSMFSVSDAVMEKAGSLKDVPQVDVLIVTALKDERDALLKVLSRHKAEIVQAKDSSNFPFHWTRLADAHGKESVFAIARAVEMGETDATAVASRLIADLSTKAKPQCLIMCGICAGNRSKVSLGDVVVADRLFKFDDGKREAVKNPETGETEESIFHDLRTFNLTANVKVAVEEFVDDWVCGNEVARPKSMEHQLNWLLWSLLDQEEELAPHPSDLAVRHEECKDWSRVLEVAAKKEYISISGGVCLTRKGREEASRQRIVHLKSRPKDPIDPKVHIGSMGTSAMIQKDEELFMGLQRVLRKILAVEMEGAAIGNVASQNGLPCLVVKAVVDYADLEKNDQFRSYAAVVSAEFTLAFLLQRGRELGLLRS